MIPSVSVKSESPSISDVAEPTDPGSNSPLVELYVKTCPLVTPDVVTSDRSPAAIVIFAVPSKD